MTADHLGRDRFDDIAEIKGVLLLRHARMKDHLKQQIAEFVFEIGEVVARDRVGDFVGFFYRVGRDRRKSLLDVPRAAGLRVAQGRHDFQEPVDVAGFLHGRSK